MKKIFLSLTVLSALAAIFLIDAGGQDCTGQLDQAIGYVGGDSSTVASMDGIINDTTLLVLRLKNKGGNFVLTDNYPVTANSRVTSAAADFNGDGLVDIVQGGRESDDNADPNDTNLSIIISLGKDPADPLRFLFNTPPYYIDYLTTFTTYEIMACGAGDYDGDGDADISVLSWQGRLWTFRNLYVENGHAPGEDPDFDPQPTLIDDVINDGYTEFGSAADHWRWESNIESVDIDNDNDLDLIVGIPSRWAWNRWGEVVIYANDGNGAFSRLPQVINPYANNASNIYGVCGVAAADFDGDGDVDFFVGSANSNRIYFYRNNAGTFGQVNGKTITIPNSHGSCTYLRQGDIGNDGDYDVVLATDETTNGPGGYAYWLSNDGTATFTFMPLPSSGAQVSPSGDLDSGTIGDFDGDDDLDFFVADGDNGPDCHFFTNDFFPGYVPNGSVYSKNLVPCAFVTSDNAIVSTTIRVEENKPNRTGIEYFLSNSDDENGSPLWEGPVTPGVAWDFENPGEFLRWRAVFTSSDETVTPTISNLSIDYNYIGKREYSRTSHALSFAEVDGSHAGNEEVLYSASFEFPKWRGHLRSWNVSDLNLTYGRGTQLEDIKDVGAAFVADAGPILRDRDWASRVVYPAHDAQSDGVMNDRLDFSPSNADVLDDYLGLGLGSPEVQPLIRFVLGENRAWKLGDINHSSPQALNPPSGDPTQMGSGYDSFKETMKDRRRAILAGANDGMIHCFDARTMDELWAFIPNNLLSKLRRMKVVDPDCGEFLYHHFFVDGTPAIQDVYFGSAWHTVLICGQGAGWGKDHKWYYFALDVTNPDSPQPLWEFTDADMGETWAVPAIGKIDVLERWIAFFGSGYDSDGDASLDIGHHFYAVDVETGQALRNFEIIENSEPASPFGIQNTLPGSPEIADMEADGYIDAVYFGDLIGRIWQIDLTSAVADWNPEVIYRDPYRFPIITKPAVFVNLVDNVVHLYFGTGGDENSPNLATYSFISLTAGDPPFVEWYLGPDDLATRLGINIAAKTGEFVPGERVWADPVIADRVVYIATLEGSIESLNPCRTLAGRGRIYGRYVLGNQVGGSAIMNESGGPIDFLETKQKVRSAVTVGETQLVTDEGQVGINKRKVFIQSYTEAGGGLNEPPSQVLAQPAPQTALVIRSWREIYKVYKR